jgi:hypothetical protein
MNNAANTQHLINNCRHAKLRAALQFPGQTAAAKTVEVPTTVAACSANGGFAKKAASLMLVAIAYFFFAAFATVDYSAWETSTDNSEVAICQTAADGTVTIVTINAQG